MTAARVVCWTPTFGMTSDEPERLLAEAGAHLVRVPAGEQEQDLRTTPAAALIVGTQPVDGELLRAARGLKVVAKHGAGVDNIDVATATELGIAVTNAPNLNSIAVAELTFGLLLAIGRRIPQVDRGVRAGNWTIHVGRQLAGSTIGLVGVGAIGRLVARRAAAFDMRVLYHDVVDLPAGIEGGAAAWQRVGLPDLLEQSDFVTLHVPLLPETRHLIDEAALARMKPSAFLINAARGEIVDQRALERALAGGVIAGAALDVFEEEPLPPGSALAADDRTVLTPHTAAYTYQALTATSMTAAQNVVAVLQGSRPPSLLNHVG